MSETVLTVLITNISAMLILLINGYISARANQRQNQHIINKVSDVESKNDEIVTKVENYNKDVNGKMTALLETTAELGQAKGKADEKADALVTEKVDQKLEEMVRKILEQITSKMSDKKTGRKGAP